MTDPITERSRERVADWLETFRAEYGDFERVEKHWELPPAAYERTRERVDAGANGGGGVWVTNDDGEVLLVRNEGDDGWADPGGKREAGESFADAARREVREETGVTCSVTSLLEVHELTITDAEHPDRPALASLIAVFDGEYAGGELDPREGEIADVGWFDAAPDTVLYPEVADWPVPASE